jgi:hypothetical protein
MRELWKKCFGGRYKVSNYGLVKRNVPGLGTHVGRKIYGYVSPDDGYVRINLPGIKDQLLHVLVARKFIGPCPPGKEVNHKDLNKRNNRSDNLEYISHSRNTKHYFKNSGVMKINYKDIKEVRKLKQQGWLQKDIATKLDISCAYVSMILHRKRATSLQRSHYQYMRDQK